MEEAKVNKNSNKWLVLLFILFLLFTYRFVYKSPTQTKLSRPDISQISPVTQTKLVNTDQSTPQKTIKCQSVVVGSKSTTELFTYISGNKVRADYRIGATTEEDSSKIQILYLDGQLYLWKPPIYYGGPKPDNPPGDKMTLSDFEFDVDVSKLGVVQRFGNTPLSGDHLCSEWDDVDPVFEVPSDFKFEETADINSKIAGELKKICQTCDGAGSEDVRSTCRKNLVCN
ncbi:MAG: hypothetical protein WC686_02740 [Candidatus Shapirobacteria bacterium]|jgi:hypothetical protein